VRSWSGEAAGPALDEARAELAARAATAVGPGATTETGLDCRYRGQRHEITVGSLAAFPDEHRRRNGHARPGAPVEVVALRARAARPAPLTPESLPVPPRSRVRGPAVAAEPDCTFWVPDGWIAEPGPLGTWVARRTP
jgi:N-methylhydantoinase A/oxoprolinase/acetone carboxylase beta subunit